MDEGGGKGKGEDKGEGDVALQLDPLPTVG